MRVLYFSPFMPFPTDSGAALRTAGILRCLTHFAEVSFLGLSAPNPAPQALAQLAAITPDFELLPLHWPKPRPDSWLDQLRGLSHYPSEAFYRFITPTVTQKIAQQLQAARHDVFLLESEFTALPLVQQLPRLPRQRMAWVVSFLDVLSGIAARQANALPRRGIYKLRQWVDAYKLRWFERQVLRHADAALAMSAIDRARLKALHPPAEITVVPNGIDVPPSLPERQAATPVILLVGTFTYAPNEAAFCFFVQEVLPPIQQKFSNVEFWAAGKGATPHMQALAAQNPAVRLVGADGQVAQFYRQAAVAVAPIHVGGGTRFKILEAFAQGVPVVATTIGYEGIEARPNVDLLVADTSEAMAAAVMHILSEPALGAALAQQAYAQVALYDWRCIARNLQQVLEKVMARRRLRSASVYPPP